MWQKRYQITTDVPSSRLWAVIADVAHWAAWDSDIEFMQVENPPEAGAEFLLKPKGAPGVKLTIEEFQPPQRFVDVTQFPLAKMRTVHEFVETASETQIHVTVQVWGILGFLWTWLVGQKQIAGLPEQTQQFIQRARHM